MSSEHVSLEYASPSPKVAASSRQMFWYCLPIAIVIATYLGGRIYDDGDGRDLGGACVLVFAAPAALIGSALALYEFTKPRRFVALFNGLLGAAIIVVGTCGGIWAILQFGLFK